jgi:hypothetical protein
VSTEYLSFVIVYAALLVAGSFLVLTDGGQTLILGTMERLGSRTGTGPWGFLQSFGHEPSMEGFSVTRRAQLAESYLATAQEQTLVGARVSLWVLISGCVACSFAAMLIVGVLPAYVVSGVWAYETYRRAALVVVDGSAAGGLVMGLGLLAWLVRRATHVNCTDGCAAARSLVAARSAGIPTDLAHELESGSYPRLKRLLDHVPG